MCKKLLSGLFGGGEQQKTPAAAPTAAVNPANEAVVKEDGTTATTRNPGMVTQVSDDRKRKGVPGLSL